MIVEGQYRILLFPDADQTTFESVAKAIEYPLSRITRSTNSRLLKINSPDSKGYVLSLYADLMIDQPPALDRSRLNFPTIDQVEQHIDKYGVVGAFELFEVLDIA